MNKNLLFLFVIVVGLIYSSGVEGTLNIKEQEQEKDFSFLFGEIDDDVDISSINFESVIEEILKEETENRGIPKNTTCRKKQYCNSLVCTTVCERGTVKLDNWLLNTLKTQRKLSYTKDFCYAQLPGSLNSAITIADGYGNIDRIFEKLLFILKWIGHGSTKIQTNDQYFSLTDQLRMGIRAIELDVHWVSGDLRISNCGGVQIKLIDQLVRLLNSIAERLGWKIQWDTNTIGCRPSLSSISSPQQRTFQDALEEISIWLNENSDEFLVIYLDDFMNLLEWEKVDYLVNFIEKYFGDRVFTPLDKEKKGSWEISIDEMISMKKNVIFVSKSDYGEEMKKFIFSRPEVCGWMETDINNFSSFPVCAFSKVKSNHGKLIRVSSSELVYGPINSNGQWGQNEKPLDENNLSDFVNCNVNIISPDLVHPGKMETQVWTWARGEPKFHCPLLDSDVGRWTTSKDCHLTLPAACKKQFPANRNAFEWQIVSSTSYQNVSCPSGFKFKSPVTPFENQVLLSLMKRLGQKRVWINLNQTSLINEESNDVFDIFSFV